MRFEWDEEKARRNLAKHGVAFEDAAYVFEDPLHLIQFDRIEDGEERYWAIGLVGGVRILVVAHTYPDSDVIRIISARKATRNERIQYEG